MDGVAVLEPATDRRLDQGLDRAQEPRHTAARRPVPATTRHGLGGLRETADDQEREAQADDEDGGTDGERVHDVTAVRMSWSSAVIASFACCNVASWPSIEASARRASWS
jgi:hypothetical protein